MLKNLLSVSYYLKWAINFLIHFSLLPHYDQLGCFPQDVTSSFLQPDSGEDAECAVCLSRIDDDDEISDLRCNHMFHKVCLDRWIGYRHYTCPLCRGSLQGARKIAGEVEVLLLKYCDFNSGNERQKWWLR